MLRKGARIQLIDLGWDPDATDEAIGREIMPNEQGVIVEGKRDDPHFVESDMRHALPHDAFVVAWDNGGMSVVCRGEIRRVNG
jgi:hypothetical protein